MPTEYDIKVSVAALSESDRLAMATLTLRGWKFTHTGSVLTLDDQFEERWVTTAPDGWKFSPMTLSAAVASALAWQNGADTGNIEPWKQMLERGLV